MFFINIETESIIQVYDRLRINCKKSAGSNDHSKVSKVEIKPESTESYIQVSDNLSPLDSDKWYLDWEYKTSGVKTISVKFSFEDLTNKIETIDIECISASDDYLFSSDDDLKIHEVDIIEFLKPWKTSYKNFHRRSQAMIMQELDRKGFRSIDNTKLLKSQIMDKSEINEWSLFLTLRLIMDSIVNTKDDIYQVKAKRYKDLSDNASLKAFITFDYNKDGQIDPTEQIEITSIQVFR